MAKEKLEGAGFSFGSGLTVLRNKVAVKLEY